MVEGGVFEQNFSVSHSHWTASDRNNRQTWYGADRLGLVSSDARVSRQAEPMREEDERPVRPHLDEEALELQRVRIDRRHDDGLDAVVGGAAEGPEVAVLAADLPRLPRGEGDLPAG